MNYIVMMKNSVGKRLIGLVTIDKDANKVAWFHSLDELLQACVNRRIGIVWVIDLDNPAQTGHKTYSVPYLGTFRRVTLFAHPKMVCLPHRAIVDEVSAQVSAWALGTYRPVPPSQKVWRVKVCWTDMSDTGPQSLILEHQDLTTLKSMVKGFKFKFKGRRRFSRTSASDYIEAETAQYQMAL